MKSFLWRHKTLFAIWAVVFGIAGYSSYLLLFKSSGNENPYVLSDTSSDGKKSSEGAPDQTGIGEVATDGDFEFTVKGVNCNDTSVGTNQYAMDEAEGAFCKLRVNITNKSTTAQTLPVSKQKLYVGDNAYQLDETATQYAQVDQTIGVWHQNLAPGATMTGDLVFDIPAATTPTSVEFHASADSAGARITLE